MADRNAPGALQVVYTPECEAMVIGAHPDDNDFGASATAALWSKQGKKIVWVVMTDGAEGSEVPALADNDLMLTREQEQRQACEVMGIKDVEFLRQHDGHLVNNEEVRKSLVRLIRKYRPRVIITHDPSQLFFAPHPDEQPTETAYINHPDHRATGQIVFDAIFPAAGNPRSYRELLAEDLPPYKVHEIYLYHTQEINAYVDVTETIELKGKVLKAHASQFGPETDLTEMIKKRAAEMAARAKEKTGKEMQYAEGFRRMKLYVPPTKGEGEVEGE